MNTELEDSFDPNENEISIDNSIEDSEPSVLDQLQTGEAKYEDLEPAVRKSARKEWLNSLDKETRYLADNGWSDQHVFIGKDKNGNPIEWKTKEEFARILERPRVAKERDSHLLSEIKKRDAQIEKLQSIAKFNTDRSLQAEENQINTEIKTAREYQDLDAYEAALEKKKALEESKNQIQGFYQEEKIVPQGNPLDNLQPQDRESFLEFKEAIPMLGIDPIINQFVENKWNEVQNSITMSFQEKLNYIQRTVKSSFPSKFNKVTTNFMQTTNSVNNNPIKTTTSEVTTKYNNLPENDKIRVTNLIASGKFSSKEAVLKSYGLIK